MKTKNMSGSDALLNSLLEEGVSTIFGYPGGGIMPIYDRLYDYRDSLNHILVRHEQGAVHAAEGYARASGKVGVCFATAGPGATNLITGLADALLDSTPIVCVAAQVSVNVLGTNFFQEADIISITNPITKWNYEITRADEIAEVMAKAFHIAKSGRPGPVLVSITKNAQVEMVDFDYKPFYEQCNIRKHYPYSSETITHAANMLNEAQRPMIITGQGVTLSDSQQELLDLAQKANIPVVSTLLGISSFPSDHPLFIGNVGMHGNYGPNLMTQKSDVILAVGMRFSDRVTGDTNKYAPNAKIIHVEIDPAEINKTVKVDIPLQGNAKEILPLLSQHVKFADRSQWFEEIAHLCSKEKCELCEPLLSLVSEKLNMAQVIDSVARNGEGETVVVTDVGQNQMYSAQYSKFRFGRGFITSGGLGTMGYGLPAAMGAKLAVPDREVVLFVGDGGLQMSLQELGTIMNSNIGVKIVLLNNSFLGMVRQWQELFFDRRYSFTDMENPDFMDIAKAYKIAARRISEPKELDKAVCEMLKHDGPYLLEAIVEKEDNVFPMVPAGASLDEILMQ